MVDLTDAQRAQQVQAFKEKLTAWGFNEATASLLSNQGLKMASDFLKLSFHETKEMPKHFSRWKETTTTTTGVSTRAGATTSTPPVSFPLLATKHLLAFHEYVWFVNARGQAVQCILFTNDVASKWLERIGMYETFKEEDLPEEPSKLISMTDWYEWEDKFLTYLEAKRSPFLWTCLIYLVRPDKIPSPAALGKDYDVIDEDLVATIKLEGTYYKSDNMWLFNFIKDLTEGGPAQQHVAPFQVTKDGRGAYLAIKAQAEGQSALATRRAAIYARMSTLRYTGRGTGVSGDIHKYNNAFLKGTNELKRSKEPIAETKSVTEYNGGVTAPELKTAKEVIRGDPKKLESLQECMMYMTTCALNAKVSEKQPRRISKMERKKQKQAQKKLAAKLDPTKRYSNKEYALLSAPQKVELARLREKLEKEQTVAARTAAAASSIIPAEEAMALARQAAVYAIQAKDDLDDEQDKKPAAKPKKGAGVQFGRRGHQD